MSRNVVKVVEITCDSDDCDAKIIIIPDDDCSECIVIGFSDDDCSIYPNVDIKEAEKKGWECVGVKDYCPVCITER